jgi:hypothetical protein
MVESQAAAFRQTAAKLMKKELSRMEMYYEESRREIQQKIKTGLDPVRLERLQKQLSALDSDHQRGKKTLASVMPWKPSLNLITCWPATPPAHGSKSSCKTGIALSSIA